ncbi:MAG: tRNA preQ1(34) S-adenosylmethionine ribosyltransferase-isomerase QueA [Deltaproteobacteria bacterium RIFCSPLOWO2_02_FULL_50_16]|nr:MAG: tRNA preQ1(34) S-adenosylmethionine ribosyltransferase-isomerase QueA [Deltaproteobacteria bacterium RIFCSPLOWO2_02_FULL_50_16]OGQ67754.1 MAG: tRNA preQ1(34) S-adenosylmethionine ribosyltransferase-isomerase QueA [Deltaproteobacteria bacterium RIFCSPLOWO2_12_FULL_50_11]
MDLKLFDYRYPKELIAQHPLPEREASRLMVLDRRQQSWEHRRFVDLLEYFKAGDVLVLNDSKVFPARLYGIDRKERRFEVLLLSQKSPFQWTCLASPMKPIKEGVSLNFDGKITGHLVREGDGALIVFEPHPNLEEVLDQIGLPPLPPYIQRSYNGEGDAEDRERYQTIYAEKRGSAAAPTAGFHFSQKILEGLTSMGVKIIYVTLHISRDTFLPVRVATIEDHRMHGESFEVSEETARVINEAKREGRRLTAVGTTTARALESAYSPKTEGVEPLQKMTSLFIKPGDAFKVVDRLLTNFHQPQSTLLMMVSALAGREFILEAYQEAICQKYRLFSYGDCMLIV